MLPLRITEFDNFPRKQYYRVAHPKYQIVLHNTNSCVGRHGDIIAWRMAQQRRSASVIIDKKGTIYQCFAPRWWGYHLGISQQLLKERGFTDYKTRHILLNQRSIGIELENTGPLVYRKGRWVSRFGTIIPKSQVVEYPQGFKGYFGYERYTNAQLAALQGLLVYWLEKAFHYIPKRYNKDIWNVTDRALNGDSGLFVAGSYGDGETSPHPQENLVQLFDSL